MSKRIYHVKVKHGAVTKQHLVRAHSIDAAIRKASEGTFSCELAKQDTLCEMLQNGHKVVDAVAEQRDLIEEEPAGE